MKRIAVFQAFIAIFFALAPSARAWELPTRVYPADKEVTIRFTGVYQHDSFDDKVLVRYVGENNVFSPGAVIKDGWQIIEPAKNEHGFEFKITLHGECRHSFVIGRLDRSGVFRPLSKSFIVYSLREDFFRLRPYFCDFGLIPNVRVSPERLAISALRGGCDFVTISKPWDFDYIKKTTETLKRLPASLKFIPSEQVVLYPSYVTILALGIKRELKDFRRQVAEQAKQVVPAEQLSAQDTQSVAEAVTWNKMIRSEGGVCVFCHPYKLRSSHYCTPEEVSNYLMVHGEFDGIEIQNGANGKVQTTRCISALLRRRVDRLPAILGTSSANDALSVNGNRIYSVILAPEATEEAILEAIRKGMSVSYNADTLDMYGNQRLVNYAVFLRSVYRNRHLELCQRQTDFCLNLLDGNERARERVINLVKQLEEYRREFFYRD